MSGDAARNRDTRAWAAAGVLALSVIGALTLLMLVVRPPALVAPGSVAPAFAANALLPDSGRRTLASYRGRVILLNLWATWCGPCRAEMPSLASLQRAFDTTQFRVVAVSVDRGGSGAVRAFALDMHVPFHVLHDPSGGAQQRYQFSGLPGTVLIDRDGIVRARYAGAVLWADESIRGVIRALVDRK